jgi:hypothetical protein
LLKLLCINMLHELIQIDVFVTYLYQHGWQKIDHPNTRLLVFQCVNDDRGHPIQIVLPSQNNFEDSDSRTERLRQRLLAKAVNLLASIEDRWTQETIDLLSSEALGEALLDFQELGDLMSWLATNS